MRHKIRFTKPLWMTHDSVGHTESLQLNRTQAMLHYNTDDPLPMFVTDGDVGKRPRSAIDATEIDRPVSCDQSGIPRRCRSLNTLDSKTYAQIRIAADYDKPGGNCSKFFTACGDETGNHSINTRDTDPSKLMETEMQPTDPTCLSRIGSGLDFNCSPLNISCMSGLRPIEPIQQSDGNCVSCQLCGQTVKSSKMLMHMTMHLFQLSRNFSLDDLGLNVDDGKQSGTGSAAELLTDYAIQPDQLPALRATVKQVFQDRLGPQLAAETDADVLLALLVELLAHNPVLYPLSYQRIQKRWFYLDRIHAQQLTTPCFCTNCPLPVQFVLETSRALHTQLTHSVMSGVNNAQLVGILEESITRLNDTNQSANQESTKNDVESVGPIPSLPWNLASGFTGIGAKLSSDHNLLINPHPSTDVQTFQHLPYPDFSNPLVNLPHNNASQASLDTLLPGFIDPNANTPADGIGSMLTALSTLPARVWDTLIPSKPHKWSHAVPNTLRKFKGLPDVNNPSLVSGLIAAQSQSFQSTSTGTTTTTTNTNNSNNNGPSTQSSVLQQRRSRTRLSEAQLAVLRSYFDINNSPCEEKIAEICVKTGLPGKVVKHWFRNTLFKERQRTKDNPYNFSVPPSTSIDLEEYEKTGRIEVRPAPIEPIRIGRTEAAKTPEAQTLQSQTNGNQTPDSDKPQLKEFPPSVMLRSPHSDGSVADDRMPNSVMVTHKRQPDDQSLHHTQTDLLGPSPPKRSRSSSAGSFGVEYDSPRRLSQISSPASASNPSLAPTDLHFTPNLLNPMLGASIVNDTQPNAFDFSQWFRTQDFVRTSANELPMIPTDSHMREGRSNSVRHAGSQSLNLSVHGYESVGTSTNHTETTTTTTTTTTNTNTKNNTDNMYITDPVTSAVSSTNLPIDAFQLQKQVEALMMAAALSQKVTQSPPNNPIPSSSDTIPDVPLDLSTSSPYMNKVTPPLPLFQVDLSLNALDPQLPAFTNPDPGIKSYPNLIHTLPSNQTTNGANPSSHSNHTPSAPGARRNRTSITALQSRCMQAIYAHHKTPSVHECDRLGAMIGLTRRVVQVWFQNQRAKEKKMARVASSYSPGNTNGSPYPTTPTTSTGLLDFALNPSYCGLCNTTIRCDLTGAVAPFTRPSGNSSTSMELSANPSVDILAIPTHSPNGPTSSANALATHASFVDHLFSSGHLKKLIGLCSIEVQTGQV